MKGDFPCVTDSFVLSTLPFITMLRVRSKNYSRLYLDDGESQNQMVYKKKKEQKLSGFKDTIH
jgi:hypothetical protein